MIFDTELTVYVSECSPDEKASEYRMFSIQGQRKMH